jgi:hypothetical protein
MLLKLNLADKRKMIGSDAPGMGAPPAIAPFRADGRLIFGLHSLYWIREMRGWVTG